MHSFSPFREQIEMRKTKQMNYNCIKQTNREKEKVQETCTRRDIYLPRKLKNTKSETITCEKKTNMTHNM